MISLQREMVVLRRRYVVRILGPIALLLLCTAVVPVLAQDRELAPVGATFPAVTVTVLGKTFRLVPVQMEAPSRPWSEVSRHMPDELTVIPPRELSNEAILQRVEQLRQTRAEQIERDLDRITDRHLADFKRKEPKANWDWFNLELAGACYEGDSMGYIQPATLKACGEYLALENLVEMLRHALGKSSDYY